MEIERKNKSLLFPRIGRFSMAIFALLLIISGFRAFELFTFVFKENVKKDATILIPTGSDFKHVEKIFINNDLLYKPKAFAWVSKKKDYRKQIKPGRYTIKKGWNTNQVVNLLRSGEQTPVKATFNNVRHFDELAGKVAKYFETDSLSLLTAFRDTANYNNYGFDAQTFSAMFIPNTYEFYWTTQPLDFIKRMNAEYHRFWNDERKLKAENFGLSPVEATILASIVQEETIQPDEKAKVAGLYINRLKRGMLLQADPTIKYAIGDFTVRRITNDMLETESAYNTYKYSGLPPGPINFPETSSIEAVLNAENHNYLYMCAREDFSGYHNFARTLQQHNVNAAKYRNALNKNKIWR
ncbi:MAG: endolytic transglycosylase MltG [Prolixibacteraceae bacterium]|nr:endolytic transglycosylase MltG [Prolixibacteraceae bacterium]